MTPVLSGEQVIAEAVFPISPPPPSLSALYVSSLFIILCTPPGLGNQFHKDTRLISAAAHIMSPALLLSSAELLARGHEQINRDVTQVPRSPAPQQHRGGKGTSWGVQRTKQPARRGRDPCKVPLVTADLQNFIRTAS